MMDCWETVRTVGVNQIRRLETCCEVNVQHVQGNLQSLCFFAGLERGARVWCKWKSSMYGSQFLLVA